MVKIVKRSEISGPKGPPPIPAKVSKVAALTKVKLPTKPVKPAPKQETVPDTIQIGEFVRGSGKKYVISFRRWGRTGEPPQWWFSLQPFYLKESDGEWYPAKGGVHLNVGDDFEAFQSMMETAVEVYEKAAAKGIMP